MTKKNKKKHIPNKKTSHASMPLLTGVLDVARSGVGYVIISEQQKDIFVDRNSLGTALDGDTVNVRVTKKSTTTGKLEGKVTQVIKRNRTEFLGVMQLSGTFGFVHILSEKPVPDFYVPLSKTKKAENGDRVIVRFLNWESPEKKPEAEVVKVIKPGDESNFAMESLLAENGFQMHFDKWVMKEADALTATFPQKEVAKRRDFRDTLTFTIDPADAKDFDDAISFKQIDKDWFEIGVHIADVSYYVQPETALDREAYKRATSVYLPDRVVPMLPEHISNVLCSLRPNEDKFTFSAVFTMNKKGVIRDTWLGKTIIKSDRRFTYEEAQAVIDTKKGDCKEAILTVHQIAQKMRAERFANGAVNFSSTEVRFILDENAKPIGITVKENKQANQLIEELMLAANKAVATYISKVRIKNEVIPFPYRVHDQPNEEKLQAFLPIAMKFGFKINLNTPKTIAESLNEMLEETKTHPEMQILETLAVRSMAKAAYTAHNIGHYGLGFDNYCHFTSPIRRYPDVMVHRILESVLNNAAIIDKEIEEKCVHCSDRERAAMECERAGDKYKQIEFMRDRLGEDFEGVISGVAPFGFWVETLQHKCEGLVSINSLLYLDNFEHVESEFMLRGLRSGKTFRMGDRVWVKVVAANLDKRQMDYEFIPKAVENPLRKEKKATKDTKEKKKKKSSVGQKKEKK